MATRILGPTGSRRRRRFLVFGPLALALALILPTFVFASAVPLPGAGNNAVNSPTFEFDGNLLTQASEPGTLDWAESASFTTEDPVITSATRVAAGSPGAGSCTGSSTNPANFTLGGPGSVGQGLLVCDGTISKQTPNDANAFTQGQHEDEGENPINWVQKPASSPKKTDLSEVYIYGKVFDSPFDGDQLANNLVFIFDAGRLDTNGDFHVDFEMNQVGQTNCGDTDATTVCQPRTEGDIIVSYDSVGGNAPPLATVFEWKTSLDTAAGETCESSQGDINSPTLGGCYVLLDNPPAANGFAAAQGAFNTTEIDAAPWKAVVCDPTSVESSQQCTIRSKIPAGGNMEGYIDITGFVPDFNLCPGFGQISAKSRSSSGINASLQDTTGALPVNASICGSIVIKKVDAAGTLLPGAGFTVSPNVIDGSNTPTVADDGGTNDHSAAAGIVCLDNVLFTTYSVTETTVPAGYFGQAGSTSVSVTSPSTCADRLNADGTLKTGQNADATFTNLLGSILIKKVDGDGALLAGATFTVTPDPSISSPGASKDVTDGGAGDQSSAGGVVCIDGVRNLGTGNDYTVTEKTPPSGWFGDSSSITVGVHSPSTCADRLNSDGTIKGTTTPNATFTNKKGSLLIRKETKDKSTEATNDLLAGATFTISPDPTDGVGTLDVLDGGTNDSDGVANGLVCIDNVVNLATISGASTTTYTITEKSSPDSTKWAKDTSSKTKASSALSQVKCADRNKTAGNEDAKFVNDPLSSIQVIFNSTAGPGVTIASIDCGKAPSSTDRSPDPDDTTDGVLDDSSETYKGLVEGTYNCVVVIDP